MTENVKHRMKLFIDNSEKKMDSSGFCGEPFDFHSLLFKIVVTPSHYISFLILPIDVIITLILNDTDGMAVTVGRHSEPSLYHHLLLLLLLLILHHDFQHNHHRRRQSNVLLTVSYNHHSSVVFAGREQPQQPGSHAAPERQTPRSVIQLPKRA